MSNKERSGTFAFAGEKRVRMGPDTLCPRCAREFVAYDYEHETREGARVKCTCGYTFVTVSDE